MAYKDEDRDLEKVDFPKTHTLDTKVNLRINFQSLLQLEETVLKLTKQRFYPRNLLQIAETNPRFYNIDMSSHEMNL